ncbi:MAG TPA: aminotransferase class I/II-fold pyridoxal phosphate-dependent enzyme [Myxococcales bacterium]|jgi:methionine-gamma-lyase|nr:aminotransferase class I/II-fold pyridoxal phosphate-dependent enzyme [Myxococcales bacterium]
MKLDTIAAHAGAPEGANAPVTTPIVQSTTFRFESAEAVQRYQRGEGGLYMYSRDENPTVRAAEEAVARLEGADSCVLFGSGMGAMTAALITLVSGGDEVVAATALYGGTYKLLRDVLSRFGVRTRMAEPEALVDACARPGARACVFESPTNPTLRVLDVAAVARACKASGAVSLIDSTFAPASIQRPLEMGVDLVMHSATKFLNGHSDHLCGAIAGRRELVEQVRQVSHKLGAALDPQVAYDLLRGLKTFPVRMERHCRSALAIARWLEAQPAVKRVWYPGLPSHPDHRLAAKQMNGFGGMVTFSVGTKEKAFRFWDRLKLVVRAASLGGPETLTSLPILFSHTGYSAEELRKAGVDEGMVRMSVGLEDPDDLIADLGQALA